jgi:CheY-like chemotaxis protein
MHFPTSGEEALELLSGEIDPGVIVILSDINMPGMERPQNSWARSSGASPICRS